MPRDLNSYGSRRGNHEVMMRGTFANIRIRNEMVPGVEGGFTRRASEDEPLSIYDAATRYRAEGVPLVVVAGREYGTGSSRDWAAKGTAPLGVRAVIAESFERGHRSNLVGMGVVPLEFPEGTGRRSLGLTGDETVATRDLVGNLRPRQDVRAVFTRPDGSTQETALLCRVDTDTEIDCLHHGGSALCAAATLRGRERSAGRGPCREGRPEPAIPAGRWGEVLRAEGESGWVAGPGNQGAVRSRRQGLAPISSQHHGPDIHPQTRPGEPCRKWIHGEFAE